MPQTFRISVNALARRVHQAWLVARPRSYSPFAKPWHELTGEARREISRQVVMVLGDLADAGVYVDYDDEYADIYKPAWKDPAAVPPSPTLPPTAAVIITSGYCLVCGVEFATNGSCGCRGNNIGRARQGGSVGEHGPMTRVEGS